jgi:hypothetical protein
MIEETMVVVSKGLLSIIAVGQSTAGLHGVASAASAPPPTPFCTPCRTPERALRLLHTRLEHWSPYTQPPACAAGGARPRSQSSSWTGSRRRWS